ncbi:type II toxin-antitoxin system RelE/ParE family toxin [Pantoea osteomyelitidis]|uniref:Type II toxin-antitoxin system RelE/ParE family toxin n=1 Tax=Pantoea osteomyelitidis TaxID=3230026 RepID=A0ABW7PUH7_9GAMM
MKGRWTDEALLDRLAIWEYLAERNPTAAVELDERFDTSAERLAKHPRLGVAGQIAGTCELIPHEHYRLVYELDEVREIVWIVALIHTARCWPPVSPGSP